jgi:hypothetical protein
MTLLAPSFQFLFLFAYFIPLILFLLTQQNTLKLVHPDNRSISPSAVWLQIIPFFGLIWQFFVVSRIADPLSREFSFRENNFSFEKSLETPSYTTNSKPTYGIGLVYCILMCCIFIPMLNILTTLAGIVCWIIYWVKLSTYKNKLQSIVSFSNVFN